MREKGGNILSALLCLLSDISWYNLRTSVLVDIHLVIDGSWDQSPTESVDSFHSHNLRNEQGM